MKEKRTRAHKVTTRPCLPCVPTDTQYSVSFALDMKENPDLRTSGNYAKISPEFKGNEIPEAV